MRKTRPNHAWLAASVAALLLAGCDGWSSDPPVDADTALAANQWHAAARALAAQLDEDPGKADLAGKRVRALLALGDGEGAMAAIKRLAEANPQAAATDEWKLMRAEANIWRGQARQALTDLTDATGPDAARLRSVALSTLERYDEARVELVAALAQYPADVRLNADMALRLIEDGNLPDARQHIERAERTDRRSMDVRYVRALLAEAEADLAGARKQLAALVADYPDNRTAKLALARVLLGQRELDEAARIAAELRASGLGVPALSLLEARIAAHRGQWDTVRGIMQGSERELRNDPDAQVLYAAALIELDQAATAQVILERIVGREPDHIPARAQLVELLLDTGQAGRARDIANPLRSLAEPPAPVRDLLARVDAA